MTPHSHSVVQEPLTYLENKVIQYRVIEPNSLGVKQLRSNKEVKPRSQKQIKGPRTLDRAYIEAEKARIAAAEVLEAEKVAKRDARKLAKEIKAAKAKEHQEGLTRIREGTQDPRGCGHANLVRSRASRNSKYNAEGADLRRLELGMTFLGLCGRYPP